MIHKSSVSSRIRKEIKMLKPVVDVEKTIGNNLIFISSEELKDFNSKEVIGTKINLLSEDYEKFTIKIEDLNLNKIRFTKGQEVSIDDFIDLKANLYVRNGFVNISFKAEDFIQRENYIFNGQTK